MWQSDSSEHTQTCQTTSPTVFAASNAGNNFYDNIYHVNWYLYLKLNTEQKENQKFIHLRESLCCYLTG